MARMYPSQFPGEDNADNPEFEVYQTLRLLPDDYSVFYSKKFKGGKYSKEECEVDFLVFNGRNSLVCLEVKGGSIEYRGREEAWYQNGKRLSPSPDRQASAAKAAILEYLGSATDNLNVGWALCLPNCNWPAGTAAPSGMPRVVLIDQAGLLDIGNAIDAVNRYHISRFHRPGLTGKEARRVIDRLSHGIGFVSRIGVRIARDYRQVIEVTQEQYQVLDDLAVNPRIAIKGHAGSGKTLIAQEFAKRLAEAGQSVLLLFFNRMVANHVRYGLDRELSIECTTFHSLARSIIASADAEWWGQNSRRDDDFWNLEVPLRLHDLVGNENQKYDAIVVDEGQDFKKSWFEILDCLLQDPAHGRFVVFYDDQQDIFGHWEDLPWGNTGIPRKVLSKNCRNTKSIVRYLQQHCNNDMGSFERSPEGLAVIERRAANCEDERADLLHDVTQLLKEGVQPGRIVLILNSPRQQSSIANLTHIGKFRLEAMGRSYRDDSAALQYTNIRLFKGLEADVIFLLGGSNTDAALSESQLYTQGSRARTLLYVCKRAI